jgi:hypothetical protein
MATKHISQEDYDILQRAKELELEYNNLLQFHQKVLLQLKELREENKKLKWEAGTHD